MSEPRHFVDKVPLIIVPILAGIVLGGMTAVLVGGEHLAVFGVIFGGIGGLMLVPVHFLFLRRKPIGRSLAITYAAVMVVWLPAIALKNPLVALGVVMGTASLMSLLIYIVLDDVEYGSGELGCSCCGYSLMGNTSGRCPECGTDTAQNRADAGTNM